MRILIVTPHYWPELFRITDLAAGLRDRGHELEVLTGLPNYPAGRFFEGYGLTGPFYEVHDGIPITRVPIIPRGDGRAARLMANYGSFALNGSLRALAMGRRRWDAILMFGVSPVTAILPAALVRAMHGVPIVAWVQDLWPESIAAAGFARSPRLYRAAGALSGWLYRRCDRILVTSRAFQPRLERLGVASDRIGYMPQWAEELFAKDTADTELPAGAWQDGFPIMFAGNIGRVQAIDTILDAAARLREDGEIRWVFLGDGSMKEWLASEVERRGLQRSVFLLGRHPVASMPAFYARAGAMLVSLKPDDTMALTVPAKVQSYLAAGRPILGSIDGEAARVIEESGAGWAAPAGDAAALARLALRMKSLSADERLQMGQRGREYSSHNFSRSNCLDQLERALREETDRSRSRR